MGHCIVDLTREMAFGHSKLSLTCKRRGGNERSDNLDILVYHCRHLLLHSKNNISRASPSIDVPFSFSTFFLEGKRMEHKKIIA